MPAPRVFISYSHDDDGHALRVADLVNELRERGIDATFDQFDPWPEEGWPRWMATQMREADVVLVVCTETYCARAEGRTSAGDGSGAAFERLIISQEIYENNGRNAKYVPVLFAADDTPALVPLFLRSYTRVRWPAQREKLLRRLSGQPEPAANTVGPAPSRASAARLSPKRPRLSERVLAVLEELADDRGVVASRCSDLRATVSAEYASDVHQALIQLYRAGKIRLFIEGGEDFEATLLP